MFKQVRSLLALGALSTGAASGSLAVSCYSQWIRQVGVIPTSTYNKYYLVAGLSVSARQDLSHCLGLLSALGFLVLAACLAQRVRSAMGGGGIFRCSVALPLVSLSVLGSLVSLAALLLVGTYSPSGIPAWAEYAYGALGLSFFAPMACLLFAARTFSLPELTSSLQRPAWKWAAALAIFGAPGWWGGHAIAPRAVYALDSGAYNLYYPERNHKPISQPMTETATVVSMHAEMPPVLCAPKSLRGRNHRDLKRHQFLFAWNSEAMLADALTDPQLQYWELGGLIRTAALAAPSSALRQAAQNLSDPHQFVVTESENSRFIARASRRNELTPKVPGEPDANCVVTGRLQLTGTSPSAVRIRLVPVQESPAGTYGGMTRRLRTLENEVGCNTYLTRREFYAVSTPDADGRFSFSKVDPGRYIIQVRIAGSVQVLSSTQVPVLKLEPGQALDLDSLKIETR